MRTNPTQSIALATSRIASDERLTRRTCSEESCIKAITEAVKLLEHVVKAREKLAKDQFSKFLSLHDLVKAH